MAGRNGRPVVALDLDDLFAV